LHNSKKAVLLQHILNTTQGMKMKILLIVVGIIVLVAAVVAGVLAHPAFGCKNR
jgi:hypothetical protein